MNITECLTYADRVLAAPPAHDWIDRHEPQGELVARFVLPLKLMQTANRTRHNRAWEHSEIKKAILATMFAQHRPRREPLPGRPHVRCIRFSSVCPDAGNNGFKAAIDRLVLPKPATAKRKAQLRLGFLVDDKPKHALITQHWEPAPRSEGFGLIEVWSGARL